MPLRLEIGPRDIEKDSVFVARRDKPPKEKQSIARSEFIATVGAHLQSIHETLYARAKIYRREHTRRIDSKDEFYAFFTPARVDENEPPPLHGGFALTHFCGDVALEEQITNDLSVTVRCMPLEKKEPGTCPFTGKPSPQRVVWAKAY